MKLEMSQIFTDVELEKTLEEHSNVVYEQSSYVSNKIARQIDEYYLLHIKQKPKWLPTFIYYWLLKKVLVMSNFKKTN